jgi:hypothetical protein
VVHPEVVDERSIDESSSALITVSYSGLFKYSRLNFRDSVRYEVNSSSAHP